MNNKTYSLIVIAFIFVFISTERLTTLFSIL